MSRVHPKKCHRNCEWCRVLNDYRAERYRQEIDQENGADRDESSRGRMVTWRKWLEGRPYDSPKNGGCGKLQDR